MGYPRRMLQPSLPGIPPGSPAVTSSESGADAPAAQTMKRPRNFDRQLGVVLGPTHFAKLEQVHRGEQNRYKSPYYAPDRADVIRHAAAIGVAALCAGEPYDLGQLRAIGGKKRLSIRTSSKLLEQLTAWGEARMAAGDVGVQGLDTTGMLRLALVVGLGVLEREQLAASAPAPAPARSSSSAPSRSSGARSSSSSRPSRSSSSSSSGKAIASKAAKVTKSSRPTNGGKGAKRR